MAVRPVSFAGVALRGEMHSHPPALSSCSPHGQAAIPLTLPQAEGAQHGAWRMALKAARVFACATAGGSKVHFFLNNKAIKVRNSQETTQTCSFFLCFSWLGRCTGPRGRSSGRNRTTSLLSGSHQVFLRQKCANMPTSTQQVLRHSFRFPGPFAH